MAWETGIVRIQIVDSIHEHVCNSPFVQKASKVVLVRAEASGMSSAASRMTRAISETESG